MMGFAGTLRGWTMLWHMELVWSLPVLLVCVMVVALAEMLISSWRLRRSPVHPLSAVVGADPGGARVSPAVMTRDQRYDGTPRVAPAGISGMHARARPVSHPNL
jgi:hypothetical protein